MSHKLSVILHCYCNTAALAKQASTFYAWGNLPGLEIVFVDDGSTPPMDISTLPPWVKTCRIQEDIPWNQPGAKNLGAALATGDWLFFYDADVFLDQQNLNRLIARLASLEAGTLYRFARIWIQHEKEIDSHTNCQIVSRRLYLEGGVTYDEDMSGAYGYDDTLFEKTWLFSGRTIHVLSDITLHHDTGMPTSALSRDISLNRRKLRAKMAYLWARRLVPSIPVLKSLFLQALCWLGLAMSPSQVRLRFDWAPTRDFGRVSNDRYISD